GASSSDQAGGDHSVSDVEPTRLKGCDRWQDKKVFERADARRADEQSNDEAHIRPELALLRLDSRHRARRRRERGRNGGIRNLQSSKVLSLQIVAESRHTKRFGEPNRRNDSGR